MFFVSDNELKTITDDELVEVIYSNSLDSKDEDTYLRAKAEQKRRMNGGIFNPTRPNPAAPVILNP